MSIDLQTVGSVTEAESALNGTTKYLAGGTLLVRQVNYGDQSFNRLLTSSDPVLKAIDVRADSISIGAGVTMAEILRHADLGFIHPVARSVGGPAVRNMATIGGNLFAPRPYGDMTTALLALDATLHWASGQITGIEQFLEQAATPGGVVSSIQIPRAASEAFRYLKVSRVKPKGVSLITLAAVIGRENGRAANCRIAFGGMSPKPRRAKASEAALQGASLDESGISQCLAVCTDGMAAQDDELASAWYRNEVAPVYLKRLLLQRGER